MVISVCCRSKKLTILLAKSWLNAISSILFEFDMHYRVVTIHIGSAR